MDLFSSIEGEIAAIPHQELKRGAKELMEAYLLRRASPPLFHDRAILAAYLAIRMPACYAAICHVLREFLARGASLGKVLDYGAGPGTVAFAFDALLEAPPPLYALEISDPMRALGKRLTSPLSFVDWVEKPPAVDTAFFSYSLGEIGDISLPFKLGASTLVAIEPGTPSGFKTILALREEGIKRGFFLIAPCPHTKKCPHPSWCHFPARVERSRLHRLLKGGTLGFEDEKFSYLILSKQEMPPSPPRIIAPPTLHRVHVELLLCSAEGKADEVRVARKEGKKKGWGDVFSE